MKYLEYKIVGKERKKLYILKGNLKRLLRKLDNKNIPPICKYNRKRIYLNQIKLIDEKLSATIEVCEYDKGE